MVTYKRKKVTKYRGGSTHGGGARKKRRGAGSRGGRGRAGSGKRAGHGRHGIVLGRHGFTPKNTLTVKAINVGYFTASKVHKLVEQGKAVKEGTLFVIDLGKLGYNKLLGTGSTPLKLKILVHSCSPSAVEKIKAAGGDVVSSAEKEKAPSEESA
ncbi:MAG: uL15m family ribosomal protein [Nanoarchaeota archaeon]